MTDRIICGVDPGNAYIGLVRIRPGGLDLGVIRGATQPRPTKRNPKPERLNPYVEAQAVAWEAARWCIASGQSPVNAILIGIEAGAISRNGRQDSLAAARQAFFDALLVEYRRPHDVAEIMRPVTPQQAKKALTNYAGSDKRRMVDAASITIKARWNDDGMAAWDELCDKEREAIADALGIALYLEGLPL